MNIGKIIAATGLVLAFAAGAADVEVLGNYTKPHTATKGETVNLNMKPGAILGGGWRKAVLTVEDGGRLALSGDDGKLETVVVDVKQGGVFVDVDHCRAGCLLGKAAGFEPDDALAVLAVVNDGF